MSCIYLLFLPLNSAAERRLCSDSLLPRLSVSGNSGWRAETDTNNEWSAVSHRRKKAHFFRQCKWAADLGRSAIISGEVHEFISSPCLMNARAGYSGKINIQICITGRRQGECAAAAAICTTRLISFARDSAPVAR